MTRSKKLKPVVKHVDHNEQIDLKAVAFSQQQLQQQQLRLQQLIDYKNDYANQRSSSQPVSYSAVQLQEFNRFLSQLSDTISQQDKVVEMAQRELDIKREKWKISRSRSDAMHKVVDKIEASELKKADKIEQKYMDEVALRLSLKNI